MSDSNGPRAGGVILAAAILLGAVIGIALHQSSIGVLAGTAVGIVAVLLVWWRDRAQRGE
jgi:UDP-N-acetylmuramyl pentapeptide phosphotransferase/UDP-N-acetylglucosamine-1-phosphate transferase